MARRQDGKETDDGWHTTAARPHNPHCGQFRQAPVHGRQRGRSDHSSLGFKEPGLPKRTMTIRWAGFAAGLVAALLMFTGLPGSMAPEAKVTAATAALMGIWWMTEAIPISATALVPLVVFPIFNGVDLSEVGGSYGADTIFLFMGGFLIALSMQKWNLHRRIALFVLRVMGDRTNLMIAGFMISTGFLSMWVSNTATAVLMLPIGLSVLLLVNETMERSGDVGSLAAAGGEGGRRLEGEVRRRRWEHRRWDRKHRDRRHRHLSL